MTTFWMKEDDKMILPYIKLCPVCDDAYIAKTERHIPACSSCRLKAEELKCNDTISV